MSWWGLWWGPLAPTVWDHCGAKVVLSFPCAGPRSVPLLAAPPATPVSVGLPEVRRHVTKVKTAITPIHLYLSAYPGGEP